MSPLYRHGWISQAEFPPGHSPRAPPHPSGYFAPESGTQPALPPYGRADSPSLLRFEPFSSEDASAVQQHGGAGRGRAVRPVGGAQPRGTRPRLRGGRRRRRLPGRGGQRAAKGGPKPGGGDVGGGGGDGRAAPRRSVAARALPRRLGAAAPPRSPARPAAAGSDSMRSGRQCAAAAERSRGGGSGAARGEGGRGRRRWLMAPRAGG